MWSLPLLTTVPSEEWMWSLPLLTTVPSEEWMWSLLLLTRVTSDVVVTVARHFEHKHLPGTVPFLLLFRRAYLYPSSMRSAPGFLPSKISPFAAMIKHKKNYDYSIYIVT